MSDNEILLTSPELCGGCFQTLEEGPIKYSEKDGIYHPDCGNVIEFLYRIQGKKIDLISATLKYTDDARAISQL